MNRLSSRRPLLNRRMPDEPRRRAPAASIVSLETRMTAIEADFAEMRKENRDAADRTDRNLAALHNKVEGLTTALATKIESIATKPPPWGLIMAIAGIAATLFVGLSGIGITVAGSLSLWANAYFGQAIKAAEARANAAQSSIERIEVREWEKTASEIERLRAELARKEAEGK